MQKSEGISALVAALAKAQGEFKTAVFDRTNPHFNSKYATLTAVVDAVRDSLSKHQLVVSQIVTSTPEGKYFLETLLAHSSGEWLSGTVELLLGNRRDMQAVGSATTYAKRYCFSAILGIVSDADPDDDGNAASEKAPTSDRRPAQASKPAPTGPKPNVTPKAPQTIAQAVQIGNQIASAPNPGDFDFDQRPELERPPEPPKFEVTKVMVDALRTRCDTSGVGRGVVIGWLGDQKWKDVSEEKWLEVNRVVDAAIDEINRLK